MRVQNLALVTEVNSIGFDELVSAASAIEIQVVEHLAPYWGVTGKVTAYTEISKVPSDSLIVSVVDHMKGAVLGSHYHPTNGAPYAKVGKGLQWKLALSHECLELLVDPTGNFLAPGISPIDGQEVEFLVEICDPVQDGRFRYPIGSVYVSDFCTPKYYGLSGVGDREDRMSFRGNISEKGKVREGGYLSWRNSEGNWYQQQFSYGTLVNTFLGKLDPNDDVRSLRQWVDSKHPRRKAKLCGSKLPPVSRKELKKQKR